MRVAIDATPLTLTSGGLVRYTRELSLALAAGFPDDQFVLVSDQPFDLPHGAPANLTAGKGPQNALERRWWLWGLHHEMERLSAEVFHGTNFAVPYIPRRPSVLTLHDLSPWMDPGWHHAADRVRGRTPLLIELGCATVILTDTEAVRRQAIEYFRIHPSRVVAVPLGGLPRTDMPAAEEGPPYFLFVGTLEPRKNIDGLLASWRVVRRRHPVDLVLAGRRREDFPELAPEPGLRVLGEVPDQELPKLYKGALALVYPSRYEGFGLPVLEAMQCGAYAIISRDPALLEVAGDAAVAAEGEKELAAAMTAALTQPERAREWKEKAVRRARDFSWERTARLTYEVYEEARERFGR
ncbi:MAG TPA: glycosyltransferase family 1 protein [Bryobacteraceae bacterium]|nr:glycosyltransferase family 1 protein [Bryobacteraceae bacterium]